MNDQYFISVNINTSQIQSNGSPNDESHVAISSNHMQEHATPAKNPFKADLEVFYRANAPQTFNLSMNTDFSEKILPYNHPTRTSLAQSFNGNRNYENDQTFRPILHSSNRIRYKLKEPVSLMVYKYESLIAQIRRKRN